MRGDNETLMLECTFGMLKIVASLFYQILKLSNVGKDVDGRDGTGTLQNPIETY